MTKLTTERLDQFIANPLGNPLYRTEQMDMARQLLAYEQAAKNEVALPEALKYAEIYGRAFICVNRSGSVHAVDPSQITLTILNEPAPAQPVIPEQRQMVPDERPADSSNGNDAEAWFDEGWNACRAEMLKAQPVSEPYKLPDGWVMVPQQIFLDASDIESICSQCGDGHKSGYGDFTDGLLWVGDIQCDNGTIMHGLHISSSDYQEEGGLTLAEFKAPVQEQK
ncbi:hypothetical protein SJZ84_13110 [Hafnia paralvei]|uniref:hypothetical protein n=1 Tax=Hafnia paralvei TaxID=546367 RepID=UPI0029D6008C|nr:hypothetical protein [Hafnia paralvei]MDX6911765.1 hypothetical protein [Hafnia paralvei]